MPIDTLTKTIEVQMPARGLNTSVRGPFVDPAFATALENVRLFRGELITRPGLTDLPPTTQTLTGIPVGGAYYEKSDGTEKSVLVTSVSGTNGDVFYYNTGTSLWTALVKTGHVWGATSSEPYSFSVAQDYLCFSNGTDNPLRWDGTTLEQLDGSALGAALSTGCVPYRYSMSLAGRLVIGYVADGGTIADQIAWCGADDLTSWDNISDATAGSNAYRDLPGPITGMASLRNVGYVFKRTGVVRMVETGYVEPTFAFQTVMEGIGCLSGHTIAEIDGYLYFLGSDNIYAWDGTSAPIPIGTPIRTDVYETLNRARLRQCFAVHHPQFNEYWIFLVVGTETDPDQPDAWPTIAYIYNYVEQSWGVANTHGLCSSIHKRGGDSLTIDEHTEDIDAWVTSIDSSIGGSDQLTPIVARFDSYDPDTTVSGNGNATFIDDTVVGDQGPTYTTSFISSDTRFNRSPDGLGRTSVGPLNRATISRIILTVRHWVDADITVDVSGDSGGAWSSFGTQSIPGGADNSIKQVVFCGRFTAPQVRTHITSDEPFSLLRITYEYYDRAEYK